MACGRARWRGPHPCSSHLRLHLPEIHCLRLPEIHCPRLHLLPCLSHHAAGQEAQVNQVDVHTLPEAVISGEQEFRAVERNS
ncbi:unnamed protein product [Urochloa humidicola]